MDTVQIIYALCAITVTGVIVAIGYQLVLNLKELQKSLEKFNQIATDLESVTASIKEPVSSFSNFLMGFRNGFDILNNFAPTLKKLIAKKLK